MRSRSGHAGKALRRGARLISHVLLAAGLGLCGLVGIDAADVGTKARDHGVFSLACGGSAHSGHPNDRFVHEGVVMSDSAIMPFVTRFTI